MRRLSLLLLVLVAGAGLPPGASAGSPLGTPDHLRAFTVFPLSDAG
jgi:hypothetical protein